jgi:radical SAM protein with 4Fe4S-binding SPASM domain
MCWQYGEKGMFAPANLPRPYPLLTLNELKSAIDEIANFRPRVMLWGGEPFLYPYFLPLIQYIKRKRLPLQIITNGTLLEEYASSLVSLGVNKIVVSLDGPEEVHDAIRGVPHTFQRIKQGIFELERMKGLAQAINPQLVVNFTISPFNYSRIVETINLLEEFPIQALIISHFWYTTQELGEIYQSVYREAFQSEPHSWQGFVREVSGINLEVLSQQLYLITNRKNRIPISFVPYLTRKQIWLYYQEPSNSLNYNRCLVPWCTVAILPNGDLTPCSDRPDFIVGNLREKGIIELWYSSRYHLFRKVLKEKGLLPLCYRCCELFLH